MYTSMNLHITWNDIAIDLYTFMDLYIYRPTLSSHIFVYL